VYACLRTIDAFGIQNVDIIIQSNQYRGKSAIYQKRNMRTAMGSAKWLTVTNYETTDEAVRIMKEVHKCRLYASDLNPSAIDIRNIVWNGGKSDSPNNDGSHDGRPICIVMGNEDTGISDTMRSLVDVTFKLPMVGFAESFNLSVATAIILAHLSAASYMQHASTGTVTSRKVNLISATGTSSDGSAVSDTGGHWTGPLQPGDLSEYEYNCLYLKALINSLPQKRMAHAMLQQAGISLPNELNIS
jgi:tRNA(Leu) C34 or U34 (ribose-2'-O)-methylase TrmL